MDLFLLKESNFSAYSPQHYMPLALIFLLGFVLIYYAKTRLKANQQKILLLWISFIPFLGTFMIYPMGLIAGELNLKDDLPLHLCRVLALATPIVVWKESRYWIGVFYFWIMVGTLNANITPEVDFGFPHWSYFAYWMTHTFMIIIPIYYIVVFQIRINLKDFRNAYLMINVFVIITLIVNVTLGSNYMYTMGKPPVKSMLDILGPWPTYLLSGQLLAAGLFYIAYLPFHFMKKKKMT